jgi:uncharacterized protein YkwD
MRYLLSTAVLLSSVLASPSHPAHHDSHASKHRRDEHTHIKREIASTQSTSWMDDDFNDQGFVDKVVNNHNLLRDCHQSQRIQWDSTLAYEAQAIASSCVYAHNL